MDFGVDYLRAIHGSMGAANAHEGKVQEEKRRVARELLSSIHLRPEAKRNGLPQQFVCVPREEAYCYKVIAFPDEELYPGDLLEFAGRKWMVTDVPSSYVLQKTGIVWECNHLFRFQNSEGKIIERWGVLDDGNYSTDINSGLQVAYTNSQYKMYMQLDSETRKIFIDKRFAVGTLFDKNGDEILDVYQITDIDPVSRSYGGGHLLVLHARSDDYNPLTDNLEKGICDYVAPGGEKPTPPKGQARIVVDGRETIRAGTGERRYTAHFYHAATEDTASEKVVSWDVSAEPDVGAAVSWHADGNTLFVSALDVATGATVTIRAFDSDGVYLTGEVTAKVVTML